MTLHCKPWTCVEYVTMFSIRGFLKQPRHFVGSAQAAIKGRIDLGIDIESRIVHVNK